MAEQVRAPATLAGSPQSLGDPTLLASTDTVCAWHTSKIQILIYIKIKIKIKILNVLSYLNAMTAEN